MSWERIRPLALGVPFRETDVLLAEEFDPTADEAFFRPIGGGIEFGESSREALVREFREEFEVEIDVERYLGTIENVFTFDGEPGHEIVLLYEVTVPADLRAEDPVTGDEHGKPFTVRWLGLDTLSDRPEPVYPTGLGAVLAGDTWHVAD